MQQYFIMYDNFGKEEKLQVWTTLKCEPKVKILIYGIGYCIDIYYQIWALGNNILCKYFNICSVERTVVWSIAFDNFNRYFESWTQKTWGPIHKENLQQFLS